MKSSEEKVKYTNEPSVQHQGFAFCVTIFLSTKTSTKVNQNMRGKTGNSRTCTKRETLGKIWSLIIHFRSVFWFLFSKTVVFYVRVSMHVCVFVCVWGNYLIICPIAFVLGQSEKEPITWICSQLYFFGLSSHQLCKLNTVRNYMLLSGKLKESIRECLTWGHRFLMQADSCLLLSCPVS